MNLRSLKTFDSRYQFRYYSASELFALAELALLRVYDVISDLHLVKFSA